MEKTDILPDSESGLPNIAEVLAPVLFRIPRAQQPLLIAFAERLAAERYRRWADGPTMRERAGDLHACADREEEIARRIEGLFPDAATAQRELVAAHPEIDAVNRSLFEGRPLPQQLAIQARGERLGVATWNSFAAHHDDTRVRETFLTCARLEEKSAVVLESLLREGPHRSPGLQPLGGASSKQRRSPS
jgi:hypothetical protein